MREDGELACHHRREGGFVDEGGHGGPAARYHFDPLTSRTQVHQEALPAQLGLGQSLHGASGASRQNNARGNGLADKEIGNGKFQCELRRGRPRGGRLGDDLKLRGGHCHGFAINLDHKLGHGERAQAGGADTLVERGPRLQAAAGHLEHLALGAGADFQLGRGGESCLATQWTPRGR